MHPQSWNLQTKKLLICQGFVTPTVASRITLFGISYWVVWCNSNSLSRKVWADLMKTPQRITSKKATVSVSCQNIIVQMRKSRGTANVCSVQASLRDWNVLGKCQMHKLVKNVLSSSEAIFLYCSVENFAYYKVVFTSVGSVQNWVLLILFSSHTVFRNRGRYFNFTKYQSPRWRVISGSEQQQWRLSSTDVLTKWWCWWLQFPPNTTTSWYWEWWW